MRLLIAVAAIVGGSFVLALLLGACTKRMDHPSEDEDGRR